MLRFTAVIIQLLINSFDVHDTMCRINICDGKDYDYNYDYYTKKVIYFIMNLFQ